MSDGRAAGQRAEAGAVRSELLRQAPTVADFVLRTETEGGQLPAARRGRGRPRGRGDQRNGRRTGVEVMTPRPRKALASKPARPPSKAAWAAGPPSG